MKTRKQILSIFLVALMLLTAAPLALADNVVEIGGQCGENVFWKLDDQGKLTIFGEGEMDRTGFLDETDCKEKIKTVEIQNGVTSIGYAAFANCINLQHVTIPDGVTTIGGEAFFRCGSLTSIDLPLGLTTIAMMTFAGCFRLQSVTIPDGLTKIDSEAFFLCSNLASITIPNSLTYIGSGAFFECESLTDITIPDGVTYIGSDAFDGCISLQSITIPSNVTSIQFETFSHCRSLQSITIPDNVTSIGKRAFCDCIGLTSITIPRSVTSIASDAFSDCSGLSSIEIAEDNPSFCSENGILFNKEKTTLIMCPAKKTEATIPNGVITIGEFAFSNCTNLISVIIPDSVTSIGYSAFFQCTSLTSVTIPKGVTSITSDMFYGCSGLSSIETAEDNPSFCSENGILFNKEKTILIMCPAKKTEVTIPSGVVTIGKCAFSNCTSLISVIIPDSVTSIGLDAFSECTSLTNITIPSSTKSIGYNAFAWCSNLTDVFFDADDAAWHAIDVKDGNEPLLNANIHYGWISIPPMFDKASGVSLRYSQDAFEKTAVSLHVEMLELQIETVRAWIIAPVDTVGNEVQPSQPVQIRLPLPEDWNQMPLLIMHFYDNGENEIINNYQIEGDSVTFWVSRFSRFTVSIKEETMHTHTYISTITKPAVCTQPGVLIYTCVQGDDTYTETITALGHTDENNDGHCDACGEQMTGGDHCKFCGKIHNGGFFDKLTGFFHKIFAIFKR